MIRPRLRRARPVGSVLAALLSLSACDPAEDPGVWDEGPAFLILAPAAVQPASPDDGTAVFVQARGGSFASIVTYGGKHRYTSLARDAVSSCADLPGDEPLYLIVKPDGPECVVEARLYGDCDSLPDGGTALGICGVHDAFVTSAVLTVPNRRMTRDGGPDAATDAKSEASR